MEFKADHVIPLRRQRSCTSEMVTRGGRSAASDWVGFVARGDRPGCKVQRWRPSPNLVNGGRTVAKKKAAKKAGKKKSSKKKK
jgi:hypothetical protein